jgi:LysM repeat protein
VQGGRAKGIEHLEDYVFRNGSEGIRKALDIVKHTVADTPKTTTVKWDGSPALIFGRDANGTFVLTDVSGFTAKGYNGLFTSPRQVLQQLAARDAAAAEQGKAATRVQDLAPIYQKLWPMLDAAVPKNYRGFVQGDLLYMTTPPVEAGNYVFQPNEIPYRIPAASDIGQRIGNSEVGIAMHTRYAEPGAPKEPIGRVDFKRVPGLLLLEPVYAKENVGPNKNLVQQVRDIYNTQGAAIDQLFNPADLRAMQITDLPKLCIDYINSRVGTDFNQLLDQFAPWLLIKFPPKTIRYIVKPGDTAIRIAEKYGIDTKSLKGQQIIPGQEITFTVPAPKYRHIAEYLESPRSNLNGLAAAFEAWELLHMIKMDLLGQLDLQHPGQEGWVMATPAGMAKAVNRLAGGFTAANRQRNNQELAANS